MRSLATPYLPLALLALTLTAYLPLWKNDFVGFDDDLYITENPHVLSGLNRDSVYWAFTNVSGNYWQPLTWLTLQFDAHCFSKSRFPNEVILSPAAFHGQNLFWHSASVLALFSLWRRITAARGRSFLIAGLFAVHPMHVESVAWAAERKDVLSCFFGILTVWGYVRYLERPSRQRYLAMLAAFLLSLMAKPLLLTLPVLLLLLDCWPLRRIADAKSLRRRIREKGPLIVVAAGFAAATLIVRGETGAGVPLNMLPISLRLLNALTAYGWYVGATFWPVDLAVLYPHPVGNWSLLAVLAGVGTLLCLTLLGLWQLRRRPWLLCGWLWFVVSLLPVIGLTQGGAQAWADRFSYWPHIGLFVVVVWGLAELADRWHIPATAAAAAGALVLGCLAGLTWIQIGYWRDTTTLWEHALAVTQDNRWAHAALGKYDYNHARFDRAVYHFGETARLAPARADYRYSLGVSLLTLGRCNEAIESLREAVRFAPHLRSAWYNLGVAYLRQGQPDRASECFQKILNEHADQADARAALGQALWRQGRRPQAIHSFEQALQCNPQEAQAWHGLGIAHLTEGRLDRAIEAFQQALRFNPQLVNAYSDLGLAFGRGDDRFQAISCHLRAVELHDAVEKLLAKMGGQELSIEGVRRSAVYRCRLAFALAAIHDQTNAKQVYREALWKDPDWPVKFAATAWRLAVDAEPNLRDPYLANEMIHQVIEAVGTPSASLLDTQAAAYAALGRFPEAVETARQALDKASADGDTHLQAVIRERLRRYQQKQPAK